MSQTSNCRGSNSNFGDAQHEHVSLGFIQSTFNFGNRKPAVSTTKLNELERTSRQPIRSFHAGILICCNQHTFGSNFQLSNHQNCNRINQSTYIYKIFNLKELKNIAISSSVDGGSAQGARKFIPMMQNMATLLRRIPSLQFYTS